MVAVSAEHTEEQEQEQPTLTLVSERRPPRVFISAWEALGSPDVCMPADACNCVRGSHTGQLFAGGTIGYGLVSLSLHTQLVFSTKDYNHEQVTKQDKLDADPWLGISLVALRFAVRASQIWGMEHWDFGRHYVRFSVSPAFDEPEVLEAVVLGLRFAGCPKFSLADKPVGNLGFNARR
jgi:hypothetical protein